MKCKCFIAGSRRHKGNSPSYFLLQFSNCQGSVPCRHKGLSSIDLGGVAAFVEYSITIIVNAISMSKAKGMTEFMGYEKII